MRLLFTLFLISLLTACASPKYTIDDGRKVDEALLDHIRAYGQGERILRPAIARSSALQDDKCDTQWELPFSVASSYDANENDRVAWVRALGVDERLTVVSTSPNSPLQLGDKIEEIALLKNDDTEKMLLRLAELRDTGRPFDVRLSTKKTVKIQPFKVCRGYTRLAPPNSPETQDYHWLLTIHPLEVVTNADLTDDEALWMVLWAQGLSEEGGVRMKTYHYGTQVVGTMYSLFTIASGLKGVSLAAEAALKVAKSTATSYASSLIRNQLVNQATAVVQKMTQQQVMNAMQQAAANRSSLSGIAWMASTVFEEADAWAYVRLEKLNANPLAGFSLHQKLIERGLTANSMAFDPERLKALNKIAEDKGRSDDVVAILQGIKPEDLHFELADMPLASAPTAFSYEDTQDANIGNQPFAHGLIDGMLNMPLASADSK